MRGGEQAERHLPKRLILPVAPGELEEVLLRWDRGDIGVFPRLPAPVCKKIKKNKKELRKTCRPHCRRSESRRGINNKTAGVHMHACAVKQTIPELHLCPTSISLDIVVSGQDEANLTKMVDLRQMYYMLLFLSICQMCGKQDALNSTVHATKATPISCGEKCKAAETNQRSWIHTILREYRASSI